MNATTLTSQGFDIVRCTFWADSASLRISAYLVVVQWKMTVSHRNSPRFSAKLPQEADSYQKSWLAKLPSHSPALLFLQRRRGRLTGAGKVVASWIVAVITIINVFTISIIISISY